MTQGRQLGPITCSAVCYLECDYIWKRFKNGVYSTAMVGPNFTIHSATMEDSGSYICYVVNKNDTSRIGTTTMEISVEGKFDICKTFDKTSLTPSILLKCQYQARKMNGHVLVRVLGVSILSLFLQIWCLILELFRQFGILCFSFALLYALMIYHRIFSTKLTRNVPLAETKFSLGMVSILVLYHINSIYCVEINNVFIDVCRQGTRNVYC